MLPSPCGYWATARQVCASAGLPLLLCLKSAATIVFGGVFATAKPMVRRHTIQGDFALGGAIEAAALPLQVKSARAARKYEI